MYTEEVWRQNYRWKLGEGEQCESHYVIRRLTEIKWVRRDEQTSATRDYSQIWEG